MGERLVVISYGVDEEVESANLRILSDHARVVFLRNVASDERDRVLSEAEVLVSSALSKEVSDDSLRKADRLRFLQLTSAGVDHLDLRSVPAHAHIAGNVGAYAEPMAEHVLAMTLALMKRLPQRHAALAEGRWEQHHTSQCLDRAVCAIVGYGGIGKATARALRCHGARIWAINTSGVTDDDVDFIGTLDDLDRVLSASDVVVLAIPLTRKTRGLIGSRELALMRPDAILINVARGEIVEERALYEHLRENEGFCAGIDTWWEEPVRGGSFHPNFPFLELPNVIGSPHNSAIVRGIFTIAASRAAENVLAYLEGAPVRGIVNRDDYAEG